MSERRNEQQTHTHRPMGGPGRGPGQNHGRPVEKPKKLRPTLVRMWKYLQKHFDLLIACILLILLSTLLNIWGPRLLGDAIDLYIVNLDFAGLVKLLVLLGIIYLLSAVVSYVQMMAFVIIGQDTVAEMRTDLFNKMQNLPLRFFDSRTHGEIMSRVTNDVDNVSNMLNSSLSQILSGIITIVGTLAFMLYLSPLMTLASVITVPFMFGLTKIITSRSRKYFTGNQLVLGRLNGRIEEIISGQKVVKVFLREKEEIDAFNQINEELNEIGINAQIYSGVMGPVMNTLNNIGFVLVVACGSLLVIYGGFEVGLIVSFTIYSRQFTRPLNEIAQQFSVILSAVAGAERVFEIIDEEPEPADAPDVTELPDMQGKVVLKDVCFGYNPDRLVLKNINVYAKPGQTIALVGPTGAGKTTIMNLLTRFYDINSGSITIDGVDIMKLKRDFLRSSLSIVLQDTYLFAGSIRENIRYGRLTATDQEIEEAAKLANAHGFIRRLLHGYDTELAENASNLSQGQKQMIAIARTILADPSILILDEATSNVDTRTEQKIQEAMLNLMKNRTCFVIAHRLSTIQNADLIAVINNGEIIERGNHEELLAVPNGFYHNMYMSQFSQ